MNFHGLTGKVITPYDKEYHILRLEYNLDINKFPLAIKELQYMGFFVPPCCPDRYATSFKEKEEIPWYDFVAIKRGEKIEGWFFEKVHEQDRDWYIYDRYRSGSALKHPAKFYEPLGTMQWRGHTWNVPNCLDEWLVFMYGPNWNTPDKNRKYTEQVYDEKGNNIAKNE